MTNRKIYINSRQYGIIKESEWNFHFDKFGNGIDMNRPYGSDGIKVMSGRGTGHFGSGLYFSTYDSVRDKYDYMEKYGDSYMEDEKSLIKVGENVYRVDFDIYKNLYRVRTNRQGDVLFTMLKDVNRFYYIVMNGSYNNAELYQRILGNARALNLRCPSYYKLIRMAQRHDGEQSFSTLFMEWNGYNGVNVSGVPSYDNTTHGSVIYDLSKVDGDIEEVSPNGMSLLFAKGNGSNTYAYDKMSDFNLSALDGNSTFWLEKLNELPLNDALRILKNYTASDNVLSPFKMEEMDEGLLRKYLRILYAKVMKDDGKDSDIAKKICNGRLSSYYAEVIENVGAYYWVNVGDVLRDLMSNYYRKLGYDLSKEQEVSAMREYLNKLLTYLNRDLTEYEKEDISEFYLGGEEV